MSQQRDGKSTIERAFEIAASGDAASTEDVKKILAEEGYPLNMLTGPLLAKQLRQRIIASQRPATQTAK